MADKSSELLVFSPKKDLSDEPRVITTETPNGPVEGVAIVVPAGEVPSPQRVGLPPGRILNAFLDGYSSPRSKQTMLEALQRIASFGNEPLERIEWQSLTWEHTSGIQRCLVAPMPGRRPELYSRNTVRVTMAALRCILTFCAEHHYMTHEAFVLATTGLKKRQGFLREVPGRSLTRAEHERLIAYTEGVRGPYGAFLRGLYGLFLGAGLRAHEAGILPLGAKRGPDTEGGAFIRLVGKGAHENDQPISLRELELVEAWVRTRSALEPAHDGLFVRVGKRGNLLSDQPLTPSWVYDLCGEVADSAKIARFMPHDLRRTFATRLYEAGCTDKVVQQLMRHASASTTRLYDRRLREQVVAIRQKVDMWPSSREKAMVTEKEEGGQS